MPCILVTHTGNKTGGIRKIPLMRVEVDGNYVLIGSMGGQPNNPVWVYNLRAHPDIQIRDKTEVFDMRAREVTDEQERAKLWAAGVAAYPHYDEYQAKTTRKIPVLLLNAIVGTVRSRTTVAHPKRVKLCRDKYE